MTFAAAGTYNVLLPDPPVHEGDGHRHGEARGRDLAALAHGGGASAPPPPRPAATRDFWVAAVPDDLEHRRPTGATRSTARATPADDGLPDGRLPPLHARAGAGRCATRRARGQPGPRSPARCCARASATGCACTSRTSTRSTTGRTPCTSTASTTSRAPTAPTCPASPAATATSSPARRWTYRLTRRARLGRRLALPRPLALDGRLDRRRHVRDALDPRPPRARCPTASSWSSSRRWAASRRSTAARSSATRRSSTRDVGDLVQWDVMAMGSEHHTFHVHGHRWLDPGGVAARHADGRPGRDLPRPLARGRDPGTWLYHCHVEGHMSAGMIGIYRVARDEARCARRRSRVSVGYARLHAGHAPTSSPARPVHWTQDSVREHTVTAHDGELRLGLRRARARRSPVRPARSAPTTAAPLHAGIVGEVGVHDVVLDAPGDAAAKAGLPAAPAVPLTGR